MCLQAEVSKAVQDSDRARQKRQHHLRKQLHQVLHRDQLVTARLMYLLA